MRNQNKTETLDDLLSQCDDFVQFNSGPWVFLACQGCDEVLTTKVTALFNLEKKYIKNTTILFSKDPNLNHKEKSLRLFFAGVFITSQVQTASACLGQFNVMGQRLKNHEQPLNDISFAENLSEDFLNWTPKNGEVCIGAAHKIYLEHAGIQLATNSISGTEWATRLLSSAEALSSEHLKRSA